MIVFMFLYVRLSLISDTFFYYNLNSFTCTPTRNYSNELLIYMQTW